MTTKVEFFYDYGSPTSYLAWTQLPDLCARQGAELVRRPILLGGVFKATGNNTPVMVKPKGAWMFDDITRYAERYGVSFSMNPHFIFNTLPAMRGAIWAGMQGQIEAYDQAMFEAAWVTGRDLADAETLGAIVAEAGLDPEAAAAGIADPAVKQALVEATGEAVERGVFGAPTMFVDGVMHFGQDRLDFVEAALAANA